MAQVLPKPPSFLHISGYFPGRLYAGPRHSPAATERKYGVASRLSTRKKSRRDNLDTITFATAKDRERSPLDYTAITHRGWIPALSSPQRFEQSHAAGHHVVAQRCAEGHREPGAMHEPAFGTSGDDGFQRFGADRLADVGAVAALLEDLPVVQPPCH